MTYPVLAPQGTWYQGEFPKEEITEIQILKSEDEAVEIFIANGWADIENDILDIDESWSACADPFDISISCARKGTLLFIVGNGSDKIQLSADASRTFSEFSALTKIDGANLLDVSETTDIFGMFAFCSSLTSLDVSNWDTSKVTNMGSVFGACSSLITLDVSNWDTSKVTNMGSVFEACSSLITLDLSNWDTSKVTYMGAMFGACSSLITLDLSNWDTSKVTYMGAMFDSCYALTSLDVSNWDTSNVTVTAEMFQNCYSLTYLDFSNWDTSKVTYDFYMFHETNRLEKITLGEKFRFDGDGYLPKPSSKYIEGADGYWVAVGEAYKIYKYLPSEIPNNTAQTYYAVVPSWVNNRPCIITSGTWLSIGKKIREKIGTEKRYVTREMPQAIEEVYEKGGKASKEFIKKWVEATLTEIKPEDLEGVTEIEDYTFYSAYRIEKVHLPEGVKRIESCAFEWCDMMREMIFPSSVEYIGEWLVGTHSKVDYLTITILGTTPPRLGDGEYLVAPMECIHKIIVPQGCGDVYKNDTNWAVLADYIEEATE